MSCDSSSFPSAYSAAASLGGSQPDYALVQYAGLLPDGPILDVGIGDGRNSLFLAKMGREVQGIDESEQAVRACLARAHKAGLEVSASVADLRELDVRPGNYALAIAAWVLHFFHPDEYQEAASKFRGGLVPGGLMYVAVFTPADPAYPIAKQRFEPVGERTFCRKRIGRYLHYFTRDEVLSLCDGLETIYLAEGTKLDLSHDDPHSHGFIEYLGRAPG